MDALIAPDFEAGLQVFKQKTLLLCFGKFEPAPLCVFIPYPNLSGC